MQVTIITLDYNEELILPYFIRHYRGNFPNCKIFVFDNESTDNTAKIARQYGCEVITYHTDNQLNDLKYLEIKNHAWKTPEANDGWVFVVDTDEFCQITQAELQAETDKGTTMLDFEGFNMVNRKSYIDIPNMIHGVPDPQYSKRYAFRPSHISEINYTPGCHVCHPVGTVRLSERTYACYHYKYIHPHVMIERYRRNLQRMCIENRRKGMGSHYAQNAAQITNDFESAKIKSVQVREPMEQPKLKLFIAGFLEEHRARTPLNDSFEFVNLSTCAIPHYSDNLLSEHRLYLGTKSLQFRGDYMGILTWRWHQKCKHMIPLEKIPLLPFEENTVWAAWPEPNWYKHSIVNHKGIQKYLDELCEFTGLSSEGVGIYGNNFICSRLVFAQFWGFFMDCFSVFHAKYGLHGFDFWVKEKDVPRLPSVFYERVAALYFANRKDLVIKQIPGK